MVTFLLQMRQNNALELLGRLPLHKAARLGASLCSYETRPLPGHSSLLQIKVNKRLP